MQNGCKNLEDCVSEEPITHSMAHMKALREAKLAASNVKAPTEQQTAHWLSLAGLQIDCVFLLTSWWMARTMKREAGNGRIACAKKRAIADRSLNGGSKSTREPLAPVALMASASQRGHVGFVLKIIDCVLFMQGISN